MAPFPITLSESVQADLPDAVNVPERVGEINPFLSAVLSGRTVKEAAQSGIGLFQKGNQIVDAGGFRLA